MAVLIDAPERTIQAVFADGGCIRANPSKIGGTWAYCYTDSLGIVSYASGVLRINPEKPELAHSITNNQSEYFAIAKAMYFLPVNWSGVIYSDSKIAINKIMESIEGKRSDVGHNIPITWVESIVKIAKRLGEIHFCRISGHPSKEEVLLSRSKDSGSIVSHWNVCCDELCKARAAEYVAYLKTLKKSEAEGK